MSSQPFPHENCSSLGISTTMNESGDVQNLDVQNLSDALHSFSTDNSFAAQCTAALLDKSFELSTRIGGLSVGGFFFMAMTGTSSYAFARDAKAVQKNDDNVTKVGDTKDDIAHSLDAATLLIQASHWALLKLRRFARHGIADRRVRARKRTQHLQRIVNTWKSTHQKLQQTFNLCDQVWHAAAARRNVPSTSVGTTFERATSATRVSHSSAPVWFSHNSTAMRLSPMPIISASCSPQRPPQPLRPRNTRFCSTLSRSHQMVPSLT